MAKNGTVGLGYTRKSLVFRRSDETSVERQATNVQRTIETNGLKVEIHSDAEGHRSGRNDRYRPAWRTIMRRIADPDVRLLVIDSISRAWRSVEGWAALLRKAEQ